jgi:NADPH:quinone reductase-like Zn-dependent oxidoreductase
MAQMVAYQIRPGETIEGLKLFEPTLAPLAEREVRIRVAAVSLNFRDLLIARGAYPLPNDRPLIPCSDGAGMVLAVGAKVTRFKPGDRVAGSFFPDWIDGDPTPAKVFGSLGGVRDGVLATEIALPEDALVAVPETLSFVEAATLPCTGATAWNALFVFGALKPGDSVLLLGTGGVSIMALQIAKAAGLRAIVTSSSDEKLERATALGAAATINYRSTPKWETEVLRLTEGAGVDLVVEVGGRDTLARSIASTRFGGSLAIVGGVSGFDGGLSPGAMIFGAKRAGGIFVGSRKMLEDVTRFIALAGVKPAVDQIFPFAEAPAAYRRLASGEHFGKLVIEID